MQGNKIADWLLSPIMKRTAGERIVFWALPAVAVVWIAAFFLFPGFLPPMSPQWSAQRVAAFYADHTSRVRYSMILFNWFCVALIPILMLIVERMRGMAHRTPDSAVLRDRGRRCRPHRLSHGDDLLAARGVPALSGPSANPALQRPGVDHLHMCRALPRRPLLVPGAWRSTSMGKCDLCSRSGSATSTSSSPIALVPAGFAGLTLTGPFAWNGFLSFWVKNVAIALWLVVMAVVLGQAIGRDRLAEQVSA